MYMGPTIGLDVSSESVDFGRGHREDRRLGLGVSAKESY